MPTPIELNLSSLLPTVSYLPPELITLSTSLLAQSRTKAASLKPEEEIGRTYACCHIACQRLGHKLALEIATPTPPVKPKVYEKLHKYFNTVLKTTATPRTPSKQRVAPIKSGARPTNNGRSARTAPVKRVTTGVTRTASARQEEADVVPSFVMPLIRNICKTFDAREATPHLFAAVDSVLQVTNGEMVNGPPSKKRRTTSNESKTDAEIKDESVPALILTLFSTVSGKMYGEDTAGDFEFCLKAAQVVRDYCKANAKKMPFDLHEASDMTQDIKDFNEKALNGWMEMEWYHNTPSFETTVGANEEGSQKLKAPSKTPLRRKEKHGGVDEQEESGEAGLLPGLGTMFQPAIDWLSDERRAEYAQWKYRILREAAVLDRAEQAMAR